ncbi:MAG: GNAT family N-acetyltransferase, partial [Burkholderiaceae bacterium]|nr:GNAT family N-acetyltransferase [Burkholderiaceae bacterium]
EFCRAASVPESTPYEAWHFGDSPQLAHALAERVLHGPKRATAGAGWAVDRAPASGATADGYSVITEFDGTPRGVIRSTTVERKPLNHVDAQFAWDEGEGDRTLADWLAGHRAYFQRECAAAGVPYADDMDVQLERFELLYPFDRALAAPDGPRIVPGYLPGAIGAVATLHAGYYGARHGFGAYFEAKVAREFAEFIARFDPARDGLWLVVDRGQVLGSIVIDGSEPAARAHGVAHLRWLILADALRGRGAGRRLVDGAMTFCRRIGVPMVYLNTFAGLDAARALYERAGFRLVQEVEAVTWGRRMREQRFEWRP